MMAIILDLSLPKERDARVFHVISKRGMHGGPTFKITFSLVVEPIRHAMRPSSLQKNDGDGNHIKR